MTSELSTPQASRLAIVTAFAAVYTIWGSTYLGIKLAIESVPPFLMSGVRFLLAGAILYAGVRRFGGPYQRPTWAHWRSALIIGACLLLAGNGLVSWGEQYADTGLVALLIATVPLWMAVLAPLFGGRRITPTVAVGIALGLGGVALLLHPGSAGAARWQTFVVLISPMLWACGSLYARRSPTPSQPALATAMEMLLGGVLLTVFGLLRGELGQVHLSRITGTSIGAFVYLVLIGAVIGYSAYIWLLHHVPATSASTYAFVNPVVAVVLGALVLGERVTAATLGAAGLIVAAVVLILTGQARAARRFEAVPEAAGGEPCEVPVSEVA